jgi:molecular chaperone DnaJ
MDYYELLGVRKSAGANDLRRAYQKLARRLHPDLNPGDPVAADRFGAVSRAFDVLADPQRRAAYDRGERPTPPAPAIAAVGFEGFDFSVEMASHSGAGFQELFDTVLRSTPAGAGDGAERGEDLEQHAEISFDESLAGAGRRLHLVRSERCPTCRGRGDVEQAPAPCPQCRGTGQVRAKRGHMVFSRACSTCGASGVLTRHACARCEGEGRLAQSEWIDIRVPPGVPDGARIRLAEAGNVGRRGGPPGDMLLVVHVAPHPFYRREGEDLVCEVPLSLCEAAMGAHVEVPTPDGPMTIEVPAGTQTGQRFRLRKRGAPRMDGSRSDLYVQARVTIPAVTDARGRELLTEIAGRDSADPRKDLLSAAGKKS